MTAGCGGVSSSVPDEPTAPLNRRLRAARDYGGLSQLAISQALDVAEETVARWERGETKPTGNAAPLAIAKLCGVPDWFVTEGLPAREDGARATQSPLATVRRAAERIEGQPPAGRQVPKRTRKKAQGT